MRVGFIGLGNVGSKLAGSLLRNGVNLTVGILIRISSGLSPKRCRQRRIFGGIDDACDVVITCLPSPAACAAVMEGADGRLSAITPGKIWLEMSTTAEQEVRRLGEKVLAAGAFAVDCPVSGGCHRAATGNISILASCDRPTFERILPLLTVMGRRVLHTGPLGTASVLKVVTNYLATANLVSCCEALTTAAAAGMDLATTYEAIRISSGTSFVHETESQVILNGSRDISFTMDLVCKDIGLFQQIADRHAVPLEMSPLLNRIFADGVAKYGPRERLRTSFGDWKTQPGSRSSRVASPEFWMMSRKNLAPRSLFRLLDVGQCRFSCV